jgi:hypothetical protein
MEGLGDTDGLGLRLFVRTGTSDERTEQPPDTEDEGATHDDRNNGQCEVPPTGRQNREQPISQFARQLAPARTALAGH